MSGINLVCWTGMDGKEFSVRLSDMQRNYEQTTRPTQKTYRKGDLEYIFKVTYHAAIQSGAGIVDAIAKAKDAVKAAGMYDEAMKQAVEARLNAEFPDDAN